MYIITISFPIIRENSIVYDKFLWKLLNELTIENGIDWIINCSQMYSL